MALLIVAFQNKKLFTNCRKVKVPFIYHTLGPSQKGFIGLLKKWKKKIIQQWVGQPVYNLIKYKYYLNCSFFLRDRLGPIDFFNSLIS